MQSKDNVHTAFTSHGMTPARAISRQKRAARPASGLCLRSANITSGNRPLTPLREEVSPPTPTICSTASLLCALPCGNARAAARDSLAPIGSSRAEIVHQCHVSSQLTRRYNFPPRDVTIFRILRRYKFPTDDVAFFRPGRCPDSPLILWSTRLAKRRNAFGCARATTPSLPCTCFPGVTPLPLPRPLPCPSGKQRARA